jgi:aspartate racemase
MTRPFRLGILGGMGPLAGILLQRRVVEATPARRDQDHIASIHLCDPAIPDRTASLREGAGHAVAERLAAHAQTLEGAGATAIAIACHTAHAVHADVAAAVAIPVLHLPNATAKKLAAQLRPGATVGILATDGALEHRVFHGALEREGLRTLTPPLSLQARTMALIYAIKASPQPVEAHAAELIRLVEQLKRNGAEAVILGCTELSVHADAVANDPAVADPLKAIAADIVAMARHATLQPG